MERSREWCTLLAVLISAALSVGAGAQQRKSASAPTGGRKTGQWGDVRIVNYDTLKGKTDLSGVTITGSKTQIEIPDKKSGAIYRFHADTIRIDQEGKIRAGLVDMRGNVRYTLTQTSPARTIEGTAGHALYRRAAKRIELNNGVQITLNDTAQLEGPGAIQAQSVTIDVGVTPYRYDIANAEGSSGIQFTPRAARATDPNVPKKASLGAVHIHGYQNASFQAGQTARFTGPGTTLDITNPEDNTVAHIHGETVEASVLSDRNTLSSAKVEGSARCDVTRTSADGKRTETVQGTSHQILYDAQTSDITLEGSAQASLSDSQALLKPMRVTADKIVAHVEQDSKTYRYQITGAPAHTRLRFTPRPPAKKEPAVNTASAPGSAAPTFAIGDVEIARFSSGAYEPGKSLEFNGARTLFGTSDPASHTRTQFQASRVKATLNTDQSVSRIEASADNGPVRFLIEQPTPTTGTTKKTTQPIQSVTGTARRAVFLNTSDAHSIEVQGQFNADVRDPENIEGPGHIIGREATDTLTLNLAAIPYEFEIKSPTQTATVDFQPRDQGQDAATPAAPKPVKK